MRRLFQFYDLNLFGHRADPTRKFRGGAISAIFGSQVSVGSEVSFCIVQNHGEKCYFHKF